MKYNNAEDDGSRFILWDPRDGVAMRDGEFISGGCLGELTKDNVYLCSYAAYPSNKTHRNLSVGEKIEGVKFNLSGESGFYEVIRVR